MKTIRSSWMRAGLLLALLFSAMLAVPRAARADWVIRGDTIPAGELVDNDVIITGANVTVDGTVKGDLVALGSTVTINGDVEGSVVAAGRTLSLGGDVGGSIYVVGETLRLGPSSYVRNNVHFGGVLLDTQRGSKIGRDLVVASVQASVGSEIGRALNAIIAFLNFHGKIGYPLEQDPEAAPGAQKWFEPGAAVQGDVLLFVAAGGQRVAGFAAPMRVAPFQEDGKDYLLPEWLITRMGEITTLFLLGILALWLLRPWVQRSTAGLRTRPLPALGYGLVVLLIFVNGIGLAVLLGAMLLAVGLWLGSVTLWSLTFMFWGVGFSLLVLAGSILALAVFFGSKIVVANLVGTLILERLAPRSLRYRIVPFLLGLVIYILLRSIPTGGWVIEMIVAITGLGAIWLGVQKRREPVPAIEAAEVELLEERAAGAGTGGAPGLRAEPADLEVLQAEPVEIEPGEAESD